MDIRAQFGRILRELRNEKGLTQEDLASRAGMNVTYLSDLERGRWNPSLAMLVDLAYALDTHPTSLLTGLVIPSDYVPPPRRRPEP